MSLKAQRILQAVLVSLTTGIYRINHPGAPAWEYAIVAALAAMSVPLLLSIGTIYKWIDHNLFD